MGSLIGARFDSLDRMVRTVELGRDQGAAASVATTTLARHVTWPIVMPPR
jgi:hypothetical protein